jgi:hypothetical protein
MGKKLVSFGWFWDSAEAVLWFLFPVWFSFLDPVLFTGLVQVFLSGLSDWLLQLENVRLFD